VPGAEHLTWHGLRHTGLTLAAAVPGATVRNIMDRGGHSTPRAALIYQHTAASATNTSPPDWKHYSPTPSTTSCGNAPQERELRRSQTNSASGARP
jgi:hypothetical protein